jgi:hypothetical protein
MQLQVWADANGVDIAAARLRLFHERLLARMDIVAPLEWVVRGGRAIDLRLAGRCRMTADLDVSMAGTSTPDMTSLQRLLTEICEADAGDGWRIALSRVHPSLVLGIGVVGYKAWLVAACGHGPGQEFSLDVSREGQAGTAAMVLSVPSMLTGAPLRVAVVRPELQIAEKVHAITRPYPAGERRARSYDLVDAVAMVVAEKPDPATLRAAARQIFVSRGTHLLPGTLAEVPADWTSAFQLHGAGYGLAHLTTAEGLAILSAAWELAMDPAAGPVAPG